MHLHLCEALLLYQKVVADLAKVIKEAKKVATQADEKAYNTTQSHHFMTTLATLKDHTKTAEALEAYPTKWRTTTRRQNIFGDSGVANSKKNCTHI